MNKRRADVAFAVLVGLFFVAWPALAQDRGDDTGIVFKCTTPGYDRSVDGCCLGTPTSDPGWQKFAFLRVWNNLDRSARLEFAGSSNYDHSVTDKRSRTIKVRRGQYEVRISAGALVPLKRRCQFVDGLEYQLTVDTNRAPAATPGASPGVDPDDGSFSGANIIYSDQFNSIKSEWQQVAGFWETSRGMMIQKSDDPRALNAIRYIKTPRVSDATIETLVRVRPYRPSQWTDSEADQQLKVNIRNIVGAGIVFRMKDPQNYYMFRLAGEEGAVLGKMVGGEWIDLENPRVRDYLEGLRLDFRDQTYRLKVEVYGSRIQCYINDEPIINRTDSQFSLGHVGLVTFKSAAEFDYVKISR